MQTPPLSCVVPWRTSPVECGIRVQLTAILLVYDILLSYDSFDKVLLYIYMSLELSCYYCQLTIVLCDVSGGDSTTVAWYGSRHTGRCFSFPVVVPVAESPHAQPTGRGPNTRSLGQLNGGEQLTFPVLSPESLPVNREQKLNTWWYATVHHRRSFAANASGGPGISWKMSAWARAILAAILEPTRPSVPGAMEPSLK